MAGLTAAVVRQKRQQRQATADANMRALLRQKQEEEEERKREEAETGLESPRSSASWKDYRNGLRDQDVSQS